MSFKRPITFVIPVSNKQIYERNFCASPFLMKNNPFQILPLFNAISAAKAFNQAMDQAENDLIVFTHQDIFFPDKWLQELERALNYLEIKDPSWGVLGCYGTTKKNKHWGCVFTTMQGVIGKPFLHPMIVQTLDEIVLITRKSSSLRFDDTLPHFHFYGTDICMMAASKGKNCYAISAFCIHNTNKILILPREFYECYKHIKKRWEKYLPIQTSCIRVSKGNLAFYKRRIKEYFWTLSGKESILEFRESEPNHLFGKKKNAV